MVRWLSLFLLVNAVILTTGEIFCRKVGFHLLGGNIKNMPVTTVHACKEECAKTEGCVAFITNAGTVNKCFLKNKDHAVESTDVRYISARMSCFEENHCLKRGFNMYDGNIRSISFTTVKACKEECAKTERCVAFVTVAGTINKCWLKNKNHAAESACGRCISSLMSCYSFTGDTRH